MGRRIKAIPRKKPIEKSPRTPRTPRTPKPVSKSRPKTRTKTPTSEDEDLKDLKAVQSKFKDLVLTVKKAQRSFQKRQREREIRRQEKLEHRKRKREKKLRKEKEKAETQGECKDECKENPKKKNQDITSKEMEKADVDFQIPSCSYHNVPKIPSKSGSNVNPNVKPDPEDAEQSQTILSDKTKKSEKKKTSDDVVKTSTSQEVAINPKDYDPNYTWKCFQSGISKSGIPILTIIRILKGTDEPVRSKPAVQTKCTTVEEPILPDLSDSSSEDEPLKKITNRDKK